MRKIKWVLSLVFCLGLTDVQYNAFVRIIVLTPVKANSDDFRSTLLRRSAFIIATSTNTNAVIAAKCFMYDLYEAERGIAVSSNSATINKHGFRHWVDDFSPGDGFIP